MSTSRLHVCLMWCFWMTMFLKVLAPCFPHALLSCLLTTFALISFWRCIMLIWQASMSMASFHAHSWFVSMACVLHSSFFLKCVYQMMLLSTLSATSNSTAPKLNMTRTYSFTDLCCSEQPSLACCHDDVMTFGRCGPKSGSTWAAAWTICQYCDCTSPYHCHHSHLCLGSSLPFV